MSRVLSIRIRRAVDASAAQWTLSQCEALINRGLRGYREAWYALEEIDDRRLYEPKYPDFKAYCEERWGYERGGSRFVEAARVCHVLESNAADNVVRRAIEEHATEISNRKLL